MHASFDQLLKLRDEETAQGAVADHVRDCTACRAELEQLRSMTRGLRSLPPRWTPPDRWEAVRDARANPARQAPARARPGWWLPAASAAAVVLAVVLTLDREPRDLPAQPATAQIISRDDPRSDAESAATRRIDQRALIDESRRLEELLDTLPREPRITRVGTALTVADLEDRIEWVDYRLTVGAEDGLDREQAQRLWRERVDLLNSLVAVRYAQARTLAF